MYKIIHNHLHDYGTFGESTPFKDDWGNVLHVGDLVQIVNRRINRISIVCKDKGEFFIMGVAAWCDQRTGKIENVGIEIIKKHHDVTLEDKPDPIYDLEIVEVGIR